jgi:hypothetical protein
VAETMRASDAPAAAELDRCCESLQMASGAIQRGEVGEAVAHTEDAVDAAWDAHVAAREEHKGDVGEVVKLVEHADEHLKAELKVGAQKILTDAKKIATLGSGDALELEIATGVDVDAFKAGVRTKASITASEGADGRLTYLAHVEALVDGEAQRGGGEEAEVSLGGALGAGVDLEASSPEEAARLVATTLGLLEGSGVHALATGDTSALDALRGHVTAISVLAEAGAKAEADIAAPGFAAGHSYGLEGAAKVTQVDTFHLDERGSIERVQRDRVIELSHGAADKRRLGSDDVNVTLATQIGQPKATLTLSRTWDVGDDGYDLKDLGKMGVENLTMGIVSADAASESLSVSLLAGVGNTMSASLTTDDPGALEDTVEVLFTDATASDKASSLLDKQLEVSTATHRDAKVSVAGKGLILYAEASFAVHDEQSRSTTTTTLRELIAPLLDD